MKVCAIQPPYGYNHELSEQAVDFIIDAFHDCDESIDLILTPEYSNSPGTLGQGSLDFAKAHRERLEEEARNTAKRCHAIVALAYQALAEGKERNTLRVFQPDGSIAGEYWKQQHVLSDLTDHGVDNSYALQARTPTIVETEGIRLAFVICYDAYFEEYIEALAYCQPDIVLVAAMQRAETCNIIRMLNSSLAFHANAFVVRASYSMGREATTGGTSLIVGPDGAILADMESRTGLLVADIGDPKRKYYRSNSYQGAQILNDRFIEQGRTPWAYRPCGPFICLDDKRLPFPRICYCRGFHTSLPENSLAAFGAAIALGADEIEFDLWETADGVPVILRTRELERHSDGDGDVRTWPYARLLSLDFAKGGDGFIRGLRIATLEDFLCRYARHTIMNIHVKSEREESVSESFLKCIAELLHRYDCDGYAYITGKHDLLEAAQKACPFIPRCLEAPCGMDGFRLIEMARTYQCSRIQCSKSDWSKELVNCAHRCGILCNSHGIENAEEAQSQLQLGIDTILTNNFLPFNQRMS